MTEEEYFELGVDDSSRQLNEAELRKQIEDYYLPKQLVDAIMEIGGIPTASIETVIGIGFIDIADYTYLSKFLSPKENQAVLNGLYTAFNSVLKRHGGYLNKIEGDSLMFHYGGIIDPNVKGMAEAEALRYIARELFYTCVEMQRVCALFNQANDAFLQESATMEARDVLQQAFDIISTLRNNLELASSINALFQIRIRIGANLGEVTIGNFGPDGAKQWDVVGLPVIDAKRMETTAPIAGLRISDRLYRILRETGVATDYFERFRREAQALFGYYRDITIEDLFRGSTVILKDKKGVEFSTYSVQVNPGLPESIAKQCEDLLVMGSEGADKIEELLQYYRGNRYVISAIEDTFRRNGVAVRKQFILQTMYPLKFEKIKEESDGNIETIAEHVDESYSLFDLLERLGRFQDIVKQRPPMSDAMEESTTYSDLMSQTEHVIRENYDQMKKQMVQRAYFFNVIYPLVFASIRASVLEQQSQFEELEAVAEA